MTNNNRLGLNTLFGRLFIGSVLALGLFFGLITYVLNQLALERTYRDVEAALRLQNYLLISSAQLGENGIEMPEELREMRFERYQSGLYGFIGQGAQLLWQSYSAHSLNLADSVLTTDLSVPGTHQFIIGDQYFIYHYAVLWELKADQPELLIFTVLEDSTPILKAVAEQQQLYRFWLLIIAAALVVILLLVLRWGMAPLRKLALQIKRIENGESDQMQGDYPIELQPVTDNISALLDTEKRQRQRYHNTLADLAHSLKTPLAVIQAELDDNKKAISKTDIHQQTRRMNDIISHQLQRAVVVGSQRFATRVSVADCCDRLLGAMEKVYRDKAIHFQYQVDEHCFFKGDQRDLMEVLGNLLDNACKACQQQLSLEATIDKSEKTPQLIISVDDDGPGIPDAEKHRLTQRGLRADSYASGQGIGLSVVLDIINSYEGSLTIRDSALGGARFTISLPNQD